MSEEVDADSEGVGAGNVRSDATHDATDDGGVDPARQHIRGSALLVSGRAISLALNFVTQVLIVRYLSKHDYGALAFALPIVALGSALNAFGFARSIGRFAPIYQERKQYSRLLGALLLSISVIVGLGASVTLLVWSFQDTLQVRFEIDPLACALLATMILLLPLEAIDTLVVQLLAVFQGARAIFFRRHVVAPGLRLLAVGGVVLFQADVHTLAICYVVAGVAGVVIYTAVLWKALARTGLLSEMKRQRPTFPREVLAFSLPLMSSDLLFFLRISGVVILIEYFWGSSSVAEFQAVTPVFRLTTLVHTNFSFMFVPLAARYFAREDFRAIGRLYGQTTVWVTVLTFPILAVGFGFAETLTVFLFGEEYRPAGRILAIMILGGYVYSVLGFDVDTLKVLGRVKAIVVGDIATMLLCVSLCLWLIPMEGPYGGAYGGAIATACTLVFYRLVNTFSLWWLAGITPFRWRYLKVLFFTAAMSAALFAVQSLWGVSLPVGVVVAGIASIALLRMSRDLLEVENTFPELLRLPLLARILGIRREGR